MITNLYSPRSRNEYFLSRLSKTKNIEANSIIKQNNFFRKNNQYWEPKLTNNINFMMNDNIKRKTSIETDQFKNFISKNHLTNKIIFCRTISPIGNSSLKVLLNL